MSCSDDYSDDMFDSSLDDAFEAALSGSFDPDGSPVERLVAQIRSREQTPPQANRALSVPGFPQPGCDPFQACPRRREITERSSLRTLSSATVAGNAR